MAKKIVLNVPEVPDEEDLTSLQTTVLDLNLSNDMIVYLQRVIRQTIVQVFDQVPNAAQEEPAQRRTRKRSKLEYFENLSDDMPEEIK